MFTPCTQCVRGEQRQTKGTDEMNNKQKKINKRILFGQRQIINILTKQIICLSIHPSRVCGICMVNTYKLYVSSMYSCVCFFDVSVESLFGCSSIYVHIRTTFLYTPRLKAEKSNVMYICKWTINCSLIFVSAELKTRSF